MSKLFKHRLSLVFLLLALPVQASAATIDLLGDGEKSWLPAQDERWSFADGELLGSTAVFDGAKTDPAASTFLVSKKIFSGDYRVEMELTFERGRYVGVYLDFSQESQSGIWMASGHALDHDAPDNEIERGYIKTVERSFWIVRATGALAIDRGQKVKLAFSRNGDDYMLWNDAQLIAIYHKAGGYPAGPLQLRLTNSAVRIHRLQVHTNE